jgi:hypothetical protein
LACGPSHIHRPMLAVVNMLKTLDIYSLRFEILVTG